MEYINSINRGEVKCMGIRKLKRSIARYYAEKNGYKAGAKYRRKSDVNSQYKSGVKIFYERLFKTTKRRTKPTATNERI